MAASWGQVLCTAGGNATFGPFDCPGGRMILAAAGTFGGSSSQLQMLGPDGSTWINLGTAVTAAGQQLVELGPCSLQLVISGGTSNAVSATLARVVG